MPNGNCGGPVGGKIYCLPPPPPAFGFIPKVHPPPTAGGGGCGTGSGVCSGPGGNSTDPCCYKPSMSDLYLQAVSCVTANPNIGP